MNKRLSPLYPEKLRFTLEPWGYVTNVIDITLDGEVLVGNFGYWVGTRIPTTSEWKSFRQSLDHCDLWSWKGNYRPKGDELICDGTPWRFWIRWGDKVKRTSGDGGFPDNFSCVEKAIKQLIGKQG